MRKKFPLFYIIYFSVLVILFAALFVSLGFLRGFLSDYEAAQPVHVVHQIIDEYFRAEDKNILLAKSDYAVPKYSSMLDVVSYLDEIIDPEDIGYYSVSSSEDNMASYAITSNNLKIAVVNLVSDGLSEEHGMKKYTLSSIDLTIGGSGAVKIKSPSGYTVYVNNVPLTEDYIIGEKEDTESCRHMYDGTEGVTYVTYRIDGLFSEPKISAKDKNGNNVQDITSDEEHIVYNVPVCYTEPDKDRKAYVLAAAEAYAAYMQNDAAFGKVAAYVDRNSDLYTNLRTSETRWVIDHNGYSIEEPEVTEFYYYDENVFSCRVRFTHVLHRRGAKDYKNAFDMTFYYRNINGNFLIYDSQVN